MISINPSSRPHTLTTIHGTIASIRTALVLLAGFGSAQGAEIKIASPSAYINKEATGAVEDGPSDPYRYQQVFPAEDFAALGNQPHWIVGFAPRPDQSVTSPYTSYLPDNEVRLSTTQRGPNDRRLVFDDNFGSDVMEFYHGPLMLVADGTDAGPSPREFYHAEFPAGVTPFLYDPSKGNLLFDFIAWQGESPSTRADLIPGVKTTLLASPSATKGGFVSAGIFQFTFVPIPTLSHPAWLAGKFQFTLTGETNVNYVIQASTDLQSWTPLATNRSPSSVRNIVIDAPTSRTFYRPVVRPSP